MRYWKGTAKEMTRDEPVRGKVAKVLSEREVALNRGVADGVELGMKFDILNPDFQEIRDPDTNEALGSIERPKSRVRVTLVYDRVAVAETFRIRKVNVGGDGVGWGMFQPPKWEKRYETVVDSGAKPKGGAEFSAQVSVGDPVVQIIEAESDEDSARKSARLIAAP